VLEQAEFAGESLETCARGGRGRNKRQAEVIGTAAHEVEHCLDGRWIRLPEVGFEQLSEAALEFASFRPVVVERGANHSGDLARGFVGGDADEAMRTDADGTEGQVVVAGKNLEAARKDVGQLGELRELAAGFLDGLNISGRCGEARDSLRLEVRSGAAGHVVDADGQRIDSAREGDEVLVLAFLAGLVVVRVGRQNGAEARDALDQSSLADERLGGVVRAATPHRNTPGSGFDDDADGVKPLIFFKSSGFAGGAASHDKVNA